MLKDLQAYKYLKLNNFLDCFQLGFYYIIILVPESLGSRDFKILRNDALSNSLEFSPKLEFKFNCNESNTTRYLRASLFLSRCGEIFIRFRSNQFICFD